MQFSGEIIYNEKNKADQLGLYVNPLNNIVNSNLVV